MNSPVPGREEGVLVGGVQVTIADRGLTLLSTPTLTLIRHAGDQRWLEKSLVHVLSQPSSLQVICLHHEENGFQAHHGPFSSLAHDGRLQYVSLGTHTSRMYARYLVKWALSDREPGWAKWPVQTLIAVGRSRSWFRDR